MTKKEEDMIFGFHSVVCALANKRRQHRELFITKNNALTLKKRNILLPKNLKTTLLSSKDIEALLPGKVHQGIALKSLSAPKKTFEDLKQTAQCLVALDHITDPHNVGAILRSCAAFGVDGVILTQHHSPDLSGIVAKAACGACEYVEVVHVVNLARALKSLWEAGFDTIGLAEEASIPLNQEHLPNKVVFVFGSEGEGLRHLTRKTCSQLVAIPTRSHFPSLNVSNAVAVTLYAYRQKNP